MHTPETVRAIVAELKVLYPDGICSLNYQKDYELLFSTRLAAQARQDGRYDGRHIQKKGNPHNRHSNGANQK